ncbi:MAG: WG repeat-containing protein [Peptostreptococcaceae bacterium]|nr:WG repeat-containing protein [Peptostreptococcaceae bacterium]
MSGRKSQILIIGIVILVFSFIVFWNTRPLIKEKDIVSMTLVSDIYDDNKISSKELDQKEIKEILKLINSPRSKLGGYSVSQDDGAFTLSITTKDSTIKHYDIFLKAEGEVYVNESWIDFDPSMNDDPKSWKIDYRYGKPAFSSTLFQSFYPSYAPVFPIAYAEGIDLLGERSIDQWEFQNLFDEWNSPDVAPSTKQEQHYILKGNVVNVLFPNFPTKKSYALYDERKGLIESGELTSPQIRLPKKKGDYILELHASWDHQGSLKTDAYLENKYTGKAEIPNSFRGSTTTKIHLTSGTDLNKNKKAQDISDHLELVDLKNTLEKMNAQFTLDKDRCDIQNFPKNKIAIDIQKIKASSIQATRTMTLSIDAQKIKRNIYEMNGAIYVDAETFGYGLGMLLKKKGKSAFYIENELLYPVMEPFHYKHGYVDRKGKWIIPPILEEAEAFDGDHAVFSINADAVDDFRVQQHIQGAQFDQFSDDLQSFLTDFYTPDINGLLNKDGNVVIPPSTSFNYLGDNKVLIEESDDSSEEDPISYQYYLIDEKRTIPVTIEKKSSDRITYIGDPGEEMILVAKQIKKNGEYDNEFGYYDLSTGKNIIPPKFDSARAFSGGLAVVGKGPSHIEDHRFAVIDKKGELKTPYIFDEIQDYSENVACVKITRNAISQFAYIDTEGDLLTGLDHKLAYPFKNGRAMVNLDNEYLGYINKSFEIVKDAKGEPIGKIKKSDSDDLDQIGEFDYKEYEVFSFSEGYALTLQDGKYGYIDTLGNEILPCQFYQGDPFKNGMAKVSVHADNYDEQETYVDPLGHILEIPYWSLD